MIAVYANWSFAAIEGIGWGWAGVIWLYNIIFYIPLDVIKFLTRYALSGRAWDLVLEQRVNSNYGIITLFLTSLKSPLFSLFLNGLCFCRLLSRGKRISEKSSANSSGPTHRGPYTGCKYRIPNCSMKITISQNSISWLRKQREELKLLGKYDDNSNHGCIRVSISDLF